MTARPCSLPDERPWPPRRVEPAPIDGLIQITGRLREDAELRVSARGGFSVLRLMLETGRGYPYEVIRPVPAAPAELQAATTLQRALRRGVSVRVTARGCLPRTDHGNAVLQLLEVSDITTI